MVLICFFFFFQAEDGIRDATVTGVQTCALPISPFTVPSPTICPATLIATAPSNSQPELAGIRAFRSRIPLFAVQTYACDPEPVQLPFPTTVPRTLIANALVQVPPART